MKLLIIGGTGFFGKSILDSFLKDQLNRYSIKRVIVLARNIDKFFINHPNFKGHKNIEFIKGDIKTINSLPYADIVIHAAASTNQVDYKKNSNLERINIELGTSNYLKIAHKVHQKSKIVYCSSGAVYGKQPNHIFRVKEDYPFQDLEDISLLKKDYTLGKRNAEKLILKSGENGLNVSIARCFAFYGKYLPKEGHYAYGNFLNQAIQGNDIEIKAKNQVFRSYMHSDDLVESLIKIAKQASTECPIYNVGSDEEISLFDLANKLASLYNVNVIKHQNIDLNTIDRYVPNIDKLKHLLNN